jgi:hypothetical protein
MCFFKKKKPEPEPLTLPHPEEPADFTRTVENICIDEILTLWVAQWNVPVENFNYWRDRLIVNVTTSIANAGQAWQDADKKRHLDVRPEYFNAGVVAHEMAHASWELLTPEQQAEFSKIHQAIKDTNPYIVLLYSKNTYGLTNDNEAHSEIYRFLGQFMAEELKPFYPRLL